MQFITEPCYERQIDLKINAKSVIATAKEMPDSQQV